MKPGFLSTTRSLLVVDDCIRTATSLALLAQQWGYRTQLAHSGLMGLWLARRDLPDVILLDLGMPDLNGWELARQLRAVPGLERALLVMITGYTEREFIRRSLVAGCDFHLVKPVDPEEIRAILERREFESCHPSWGHDRAVRKNHWTQRGTIG
jgi:CheY-like chemotaxis protein